MCNGIINKLQLGDTYYMIVILKSLSLSYDQNFSGSYNLYGYFFFLLV